jgi:hypothetical protein
MFIMIQCTHRFGPLLRFGYHQGHTHNLIAESHPVPLGALLHVEVVDLEMSPN